MSPAGFVAGPWTSRGGEVVGTARGDWQAKGMLSPYFVVARVLAVQEGRDVREETAGLIAAAPDMLWALEMVVERMGYMYYELNSYDRQALDKTRATVAKARGDVSP